MRARMFDVGLVRLDPGAALDGLGFLDDDALVGVSAEHSSPTYEHDRVNATFVNLSEGDELDEPVGNS